MAESLSLEAVWGVLDGRLGLLWLAWMSGCLATAAAWAFTATAIWRLCNVERRHAHAR